MDTILAHELCNFDDFYVIIHAHDITNKILSRDSNYIVGVVMWQNFGNSSISVTEVIITSYL